MNEKRKITKDSISIIGGICFILLALVTLISDGTPFAFLSIAITVVFGFVGFWILLPFIIIIGLFLIFKKKFIKLKVGVSLWGVLIMIICFIILSSHWASIGQTYNGVLIDGYSRLEDGTSRFLIFSNAKPLCDQIREANSSPFNPNLGGGYVGFFLAGSINSALTPIGLNFLCWIFFFVGLLMILNQNVVKFVKFIKNKQALKSADKKRKELSKESEYEDEPLVQKSIENTSEETISFEKVIAPEVTPSVQETVSKPIYDSFHTSRAINNDYSLKKAHFVLNDETIMEDSMVKKIEDVGVSNEPIKATFEDPSFVKSEPMVQEEIKPEVSPEISPVIGSAAIFNELEAEQFEEEPIEEAPVMQPKEEEVDQLHKPQPKANLVKNYIYPSIDLLEYHEEPGDSEKNEASCADRTEIINQTFTNLRVGASVVGHTVGPAVTRYDIQTNSDVSVNAVQKVITDISIRLGGVNVRFEQIVVGKSTSGLELPNEIRTNVGLKESIAALPTGPKHLLSIPFGKNISGELQSANMADFPHMLVSGTTGSGKSIFIHSTILTLIMRNKPEELKLVLVDPKKVEMNYYDDIPHLLCPIISDVKKSYIALKKLVDEMERRYNLFQTNRVRDIKGFNALAATKDIQPLPYICVFIDEYADLVDTCKEIREPVVRIAQKARAAGIHMVIATQRPSVNVIDGVIKANVATRVALMSASAVDSTTIIGEGGAEKLLGNGDMLIECSLLSRSSKPRVQGCYVSETEILRVCDFLREHYQTQFDPYFLDLEEHVEEAAKAAEPEVKAIDKNQTEEAFYQEVKSQIMQREFCSISFIQRSFMVGFPRAGRIFNRLVNEGVVDGSTSTSQGSKVIMHAPSEPQMGTIEQSTFIPDEPGDEGSGEAM